jgi:glycosyltransferase involved in cell wall biosynthesis
VKVLISAYACEPDKGSEPAVGWSWARAAARDHDVWVLTRANNRESIERALASDPDPGFHPVYVDLPAWARSWKRGRRGVRLYYLLWQLSAARVARRLHERETFDVVHHLTFANLWLPALAWAVPAPFVLGPVAGGQRVPSRLLPELGPVSAAAELALRAARLASRFNPLVRAGWTRAAVVLVNNEETRDALPRRHRRKAIVRPNAAAVEIETPPETQRADRPTALVAGRLNRFKGVGLALRALPLAPAWTLTIAGDGPDEARLRRLARRLGVDDRVEFAGKLDRDEVLRRTAAAHAVVLPSLKEGASFVCAEAMTLGVTVIALDQGGPRALAQHGGGGIDLVTPGTRARCVRGLADALTRAEHAAPPPRARLGLDAVARDLGSAYTRATAQERVEPLPARAHS